MKAGAVVKALFRERFEVLNGFRRRVGPELGHHLAVAGLDHGNFVGVGGLCRRLGRRLLIIRLNLGFTFCVLGAGRDETARQNTDA